MSEDQQDYQEYVVTVIARDGGQASEPCVSAAIRFNDQAMPYISELTVRNYEQGERTPRVVDRIDFDKLASALLGTVSASTQPAETPSRRSEPVAETPAPAPAPVDESGAGQRPYRKMPDVEDVRAVFLATQSVGKVAKHYDVPRYTAQAWVDRLRRSGALETVS